MAINLPQNKLDELVLLSTLHDIGKVAIPDTILLKKGKLNSKEWKIIKRHPEIGYKIAESTPQISSIAEDILSHHEWWNGSGYPQGLKGKDIPVNACIASIVVSFFLISSFAGCVRTTDTDINDDKIGVVVSIPPQAEFVEKVGGDKVVVTIMVPPGANPHTYEPTPVQLEEVSRAQIYAKVGSAR